MTKLTFFSDSGFFWGFRETGHTGFGEEGDDVLCAALSAMTMLLLNTLEVAVGVHVDYTIDDKEAEITLKCPSARKDHDCDEKKHFAAEAVIRGYFLQIQDLCEEYYDYLEVDVKDDADVV